MSWWVALGYPSFEEGRGGFPRTGQVVRHYRENKRDDADRAWTQSRLAAFLTISEKAVWDIENRDVSISVDRRQRISQCLDIPPILLGIRTSEEILKIVEERRTTQGASLVTPVVDPPPFWWIELGYPAFAQGSDGFFPRTGQVVKYYRKRKIDDNGKLWTQRRLANALGIETDQPVWDLENKDTAMDFDRRQFLSQLFDIPPLLFGIVTSDEIDKLVEGKAQSGIVIASKSISISQKLTIDLEEYASLLQSYWKTFLSNPTQVSMTNITLCIDALYRELPCVRDKKPQQELLCRFHDLVANILCDQNKCNDALVQLEKALWFAEVLESDTLKVAVLYDYGIMLWKADRLDDALEKYDEARRYEQRVPANLRDSLLLETGNTEALIAETPEKRNAAMALINRVGKSVRSNRKEEDPYFLNLNLDRYHLARSRSLIAIGRNQEAIDELELIRGPQSPRRQAEKDIFRAQAHTNLGEYSEAAEFATSGLVIAQEVNSVENIANVERMYKKFPRGLFKHDDDVARLEYLLSKRKVKKRL